MIDANTLLNPEFQNAELRAYAFLSTQFRSGVRSPVDCLLPFIIYAIAAHAGEQLNWQLIRTYLREHYSLNVPFYMLERMQGSLQQAGALTQSTIPRLFLCQDARPAVSGRQIDFSLNDIEALGGALDHYATGRGIRSPLTAETWTDIIIPFFMNRSPPGDKATATYKNVMISDPKLFDFTIVADFIVDEFRNKSNHYHTIERVYYGVIVADFLTQIETAGDKASFKGLGIVYDSPLLLRLLGCSGKILQEATEELHETLRELGCRTYYLHHTYDETAASIEAILKCYEVGQPMFPETQEAISRGETKISEIYAIRAEFDLRLAALGLTEHGTGYSDRKADDFQIDEAAFNEHLQHAKRWGARGQQTANRDVMSLAVIMRLRHGHQVRDVSKAGYVFVTHNVRLALLARDFLREQNQLSEGAVWPILTVGQLSTIAWVVNEVIQDDRRVSKELIANCYAAALPEEDFDEKLKEILTKLDPSKVHELYDNAFVTQSIRQVALSHTGGYSALLRTLNTAELLSEAEKFRAAAIEEARIQASKSTKEEIESGALVDREQRAEKLASLAATITLGLLGAATIFAIFAEQGLFGTGTFNPWIIKGILVAFLVYEALDVLSLLAHGSLRRGLNVVFKQVVLVLQRSLLG